MSLKRLWDTENKKIVWAIASNDPHKKCQVWTNDDGSKLYVYDSSKWMELSPESADVETYGPVWKSIDDEMVGYYLTNEPTDLYNRDEGDEVSYTFKDYDGTVLKTGKVDEGTAPTPPADPTREATAQYTYTFAGWNPTVGKITKRTTYTATYTATVNQYTVSIESNNTDYGTVNESSVTVDYGTPISANGNVLTIGTGESATVVTATAETGYVFSSWGELPETVAEDLTITATFEAETPTPTTATITLSVSGDSGSWLDPEQQPQSSITVDINTVMDVAGVDNTLIEVTWNEDESGVVFVPSDGTVTAFKVDGVAKTTGDTITITGDTTFLAECAS